MKIDVTQTLKSFDDPTEPIIDGSKDPADKEPLTFRSIMAGALLSHGLKDQSVNPDQKLDDYLLAIKIREEDHVELSAGQAKLLKDLIGKNCSVIIVGQILPALDGK